MANFIRFGGSLDRTHKLVTHVVEGIQPGRIYKIPFANSRVSSRHQFFEDTVHNHRRCLRATISKKMECAHGTHSSAELVNIFAELVDIFAKCKCEVISIFDFRNTSTLTKPSRNKHDDKKIH